MINEIFYSVQGESTHAGRPCVFVRLTAYDYPRDVMLRCPLADRAAAIHVSPVDGVMPSRALSEWVLADHLPVRVQLQLHKFIWGPETRGV